MSIATQITALQTDKTNISNAITTMGGSVTSGDGFDDFAADILTIPQGGGSVITPKDVNFYDYDGKVLYAYTLAEAQALTALPELPEGPSGYTASSWTENLTTVKNLTYPFNIGVNYTTSKTGTEFDIVIGDEKDVYGFCPAWGSISWGDGTSNTEYGVVKHTYSQSGEYTVIIDGEQSSFSLQGRTVEPYTLTAASEAAQPLMLCSEAYTMFCRDSSLVKRIRIGTIVPNSMRFAYSSLESVLIACQIVTINQKSFQGCGCKHITLPSSVTRMKEYTFSSCRSLQSVVVPSSVSVCDNYIFQSCSSIKSITILTNSISAYMFNSCSSIKSVIAPLATSIGGSAFSSCGSLTTIAMPLVTSIGSNAFQNCSSLRSITIPSTVTSIDYSSFQNCYSLSSINIPSITNIGMNTFAYCYPLQSITIPSTVTAIGQSAFQYCYYLSEVIVLATTPPSLSNSNAFNGNYSTRKIYVPYSEDHSILNAYKTAIRWRTYANDIEELPAS